MISFITMHDLRINKNFTNKYMIVFMYFFEINPNDNAIKALITCEMHLINDLKSNSFINNDILNSKKFDIFIFTFSIYIESCNVIISIFVKNRSISRTTSIYLIKIIVI